MNCSNFTEENTTSFFFFSSYIKMLSFQLGGNRLHINSLSSTFIIHPPSVYSLLSSK